MPKALPARKFQFIGGELCLDFCNTMGGNRRGTPREYLNSYGDFLAWCEQAGLVDGSSATALMRKAIHQPREALEALARAIRLREAFYRIVAALGEEKTP